MKTEQANHFYVSNCSSNNKKHLTSSRCNMQYSAVTVSQTTLAFSANK